MQACGFTFLISVLFLALKRISSKSKQTNLYNTVLWREKNRLISNCAQAMYYNGCFASEVKKNNSSKFDKKWMREDLWGFKDPAIQLPILLHHLTETRKKCFLYFVLQDTTDLVFWQKKLEFTDTAELLIASCLLTVFFCHYKKQYFGEGRSI